MSRAFAPADAPWTGSVANVCLAVAACVAVLLPTLIAFNVAPSATFFNQAVAFVGWGGFLLVVVAALPSDAAPRAPASLALILALANTRRRRARHGADRGSPLDALVV